jgi:D-alanyl-D-alanine carboxypeptidase
MTVLLINERWSGESSSLDDTVAPALMPPPWRLPDYLKEGEEKSCGDMLKSIVVASANDAVVAVAETCASTEQHLRTADELAGCGVGDDTHRVQNCTGLLNERNT